jgi:elongation factor 2
MEPLEEEVYNAIDRGELPEGKLRKKPEEVWKKLSELGISNDEARQYREIYKGNVFEDRTRGIVLLGEVLESVLDGWRLVVDAGPMAREPLMKTKIVLHDMKIHVDNVHRGPAQIYPAVRAGMFECVKKGGATMLEPIQTHLIEGPIEFMGTLTNLVGSKRGVLLDVQQEGAETIIKAKIPVAEMIGWSNDLRSSTEGRGVSNLADQHFQKMPLELQSDVIRKIRQRKGLSENQ